MEIWKDCSESMLCAISLKLEQVKTGHLKQDQFFRKDIEDQLISKLQRNMDL